MANLKIKLRFRILPGGEVSSALFSKKYDLRAMLQNQQQSGKPFYITGINPDNSTEIDLGEIDDLSKVFKIEVWVKSRGIKSVSSPVEVIEITTQDYRDAILVNRSISIDLIKDETNLAGQRTIIIQPGWPKTL
ncbi:MAG TPA: hypothetical protein PK546_11185 [Chitinophagales bacterium]|jgi:hypothetical protein|nr:hypothetical protein [Chitinophagales bacterium]